MSHDTRNTMTQLANNLLLLTSLLLSTAGAASPQQAATQTPAVPTTTPKASLPTVPPATRPHLNVAWADGKLTVSAERVPLSSVFLSIMRRTAIELHGLDKLHGEISVQL